MKYATFITGDIPGRPEMFRYNNYFLLCGTALAMTFSVFTETSVAAPITKGAVHKHASHPKAGATVQKPVLSPVQHNRKAMQSSQPETIMVRQTRNVFGQAARQKQGISVTHIDAADLARHQVTDVKGLMNLAPNLTVQPQGASSSVNFTLRGVGLNDFTSNNTPSVMTYVDGVALPIGYMAGAAMFDMAGVDVSNGPSGYTHGQTVTAGEINVQTADPTKALHYGASEDIATYNRSITNLYVSGPITSNVQYRIAGFTQQGEAFRRTSTQARLWEMPIKAVCAQRLPGSLTIRRTSFLAGTGCRIIPRLLASIIFRIYREIRQLTAITGIPRGAFARNFSSCQAMRDRQNHLITTPSGEQALISRGTWDLRT